MRGWRGFSACWERERKWGYYIYRERFWENKRSKTLATLPPGKSSMPLTSLAFCYVKIKYNLNKEGNKYRKGQIKKEWCFIGYKKTGKVTVVNWKLKKGIFYVFIFKVTWQLCGQKKNRKGQSQVILFFSSLKNMYILGCGVYMILFPLFFPY